MADTFKLKGLIRLSLVTSNEIWLTGKATVVIIKDSKLKFKTINLILKEYVNDFRIHAEIRGINEFIVLLERVWVSPSKTEDLEKRLLAEGIKMELIVN